MMRTHLAAVLSLALVSCGSTVIPEDGEGGDANSDGGASAQGGSGNGGPGAGGPGAGGPGAGGQGTGAGNPATTNGQGGSVTTSGPTTTTNGQGGSSTSSGSTICSGAFDSCTGCADSVCPAAWCECSANMECIAMLDCFGGCGPNEGCYQACMDSHPDGASDAFRVVGCEGCSPSCYGAEPIDPCEECLYSDCEDELNGCIAQEDCLSLWQCLGDCPQFGLACQNACYDAYPSGIDPLEELLDCSADECDSTCN